MPNDINLTQRTHDLGDVITSVRNAHGYWIPVVAKLPRELKYAGTLLADAKRNPHDVCKLNVINARRIYAACFPTIILVACVFCCAEALADDTAELKPPITMDLAPVKLSDALDSALERNTTIRNGRIELEISKDRYATARTHLFPVFKMQAVGLQLITPFQFDFEKGVFGNFASTGPIPKENTNVTTDQKPVLLVNTMLAQPILQLGRVNLGIRQARIGRELAAEKLRAQRQEIALKVRTAYYKVLELEETHKVIEATRNLFKEVDRLTTPVPSLHRVL